MQPALTSLSVCLLSLLGGCFHDFKGKTDQDARLEDVEGDRDSGGEPVADGGPVAATGQDAAVRDAEIADGDGGPGSIPEGGGESGTTDASGKDDASSKGDATTAPSLEPVPRNAACTGGGGVTKPLLNESFEGLAIGPIVNQAPWLRAMQGRSGLITNVWAHGGAKALSLNSFTTSTEVVYVPLADDVFPARVIIELWYAPDGSYVQKDFAAWGLAWAPSKFALEMRLSVRGQDHTLYYDDSPGLLVAGSAPMGTALFHEVEYAKKNAGDAAVHNYVRVELDLCQDRLLAFVGLDSSAPKRADIPLTPLRKFNAFVIAGGVNETYIDDVKITVEGAGL